MAVVMGTSMGMGMGMGRTHNYLTLLHIVSVELAMLEDWTGQEYSILGTQQQDPVVVRYA
jgi:hypothetical protein